MTVVVHAGGLDPQETAKASYMRKVKKMVFEHAIKQVKTLEGERPKIKRLVSNAVARVERTDVVGIDVEFSSVPKTYRTYS